eukprot:scaffold11347_cov147-Skeletonema_dohrnii-CCMP3373.AAC.4
MAKPAVATSSRLFGTVLFLLLCTSTCALYADEAGINDFVIRTAGHGQVGVRYASLIEHSTPKSDDEGDNNNIDSSGVWVTSQSNEFPGAVSDGNLADTTGGGGEVTSNFEPIIGKINTSNDEESSCSIAGRNVTSGEVLWRVNACSSSGSSIANTKHGEFTPRHVTLASSTYSKVVYSMDNTGVFRGWNSNDGMLQLDMDLFQQINDVDETEKYQFPHDLPRLLDTSHPRIIGTVVVAEEGGDDESLVLLDTKTGQPIPSSPSSKEEKPFIALSAKSLLAKAKVSKKKYDTARIVDVMFVKGDDTNNDSSNKKHQGHLAVLVAWSSLNQEIAAPKNTQVTKSISSFSSMAWIDVKLKEVIQTSEPPEASAPKSEDYDDWSTTLIKSISYSHEVVKGAPFNVDGIGSTPLLLSSLRKVVGENNNNNSLSVLAIAASTSQLLLVTNINAVSGNGGGVGRSYEIDMLHPYWRIIDTISVPQVEDGNTVTTLTIAGVDDRYPTSRRIESLFVLSVDRSEGGEPLHRVYGSEKKSDEEIMHNAVVLCPTFESTGLVVTAMEDGGDVVAMPYAFNDGQTAWSLKTFDGDSSIVPSTRGGTSSIGRNDRAHLLECSPESMTVAFTTTGGMTTAFQFEASSSGTTKATKLWTSEEALGSVSAAVFLDETHAMVTPSDSQEAAVNADYEEEKALRNLQFSSRIQMQLESLKEGIFGGGLLSSLKSMAIMSDEKKAERDIAFGFAKVAVLLSENMHRVVALDTMKRNVIWSMNLHSGASWHKIVHGGQFISLNDPHGNGGVNDHEMLAMSHIEGASSSSVEWKCVDGLSGRVFSRDTSPVKASISQIVPLRTSSHQPHLHDSSGCRQVALLVHSDNTVSVIPDTARSRAIVDEAVAAGKNGLFVHSIDKHTGEFRSQIVSRKAGSNSFDLVTVGTTVFDPSQEKIVNVAYPRRGEVMQSPSTVLGDESLLLKYLNPHLVVVVTEATPTFFSEMKPDAGEESTNGFYNSLSTGSSTQQMRKPLGAAKPGEGPPNVANTAAPSLFVSLVDSVSGQILHRVSHSHVDSADELFEATNVPVVVSENWVIYTFFNQRTRRTDVGVLTLHEGMIDKNGITAFSAPEQEMTFSSLESAKPIILSRTFGLAKAVSALGVTSTKAGISSKQFMFATGNDQVISLDRRFLDPRRPNGDLKESEKMEGLMKYAPMLPIIPFLTPSHVHEVSSVQSISSSSAHVESQSLVLAYGGPDVFFSRVSPSKGFDLLPDDFNRGLLTVVVVGLLVALNVIQRMNKKKMVTSFWS